MRTELTQKLLGAELEVVRDSIATASVEVWREGTDIFVRFDRGRDGRPGLFRLGCSQFDGRPAYRIDDRSDYSLRTSRMEQWTPGVPHRASIP